MGDPSNLLVEHERNANFVDFFDHRIDPTLILLTQKELIAATTKTDHQHPTPRVELVITASKK
jgi:Na+/H+ antiporter NhaD/arsenite permease-like protein